MDGGFVDTTGIVSLLQRKEQSIVAFYNNNDNLTAAGTQNEIASIAYLFGFNTTTDTQNSLAGPVLTQVFDTALYRPVITNLTDGGNLLAHLRNVPVQDNTYLGVQQYVLKDLYILSSQPTGEFLGMFTDSRIRANASPLFPNRFPLAMDTFNANLLCEYERFKLTKHWDEIASVFQ